ncbi:MAG: translation initiation factor IF-3 [Candidatus Saccharimonas sp.]|nr:translation initiation factor IF-3 [Candidatus Nanosynsacchari sp. TM7_ANC_38.39_G1_1]
MNNAIRSNELRVIGADGKQLGVMSLREALDIAQKAGVDLVEISPKANPPVAKIVDWGKYQYQKMKEQQKARRNNKANELKQMRFGLKIGSNDLEIKLRKIRAFLSDGHKVKILIFFRGREIAHKNLGYDLIDKMMEQLKDEATLEQKPTMAGRNLSIVIRSK